MKHWSILYPRKEIIQYHSSLQLQPSKQHFVVLTVIYVDRCEHKTVSGGILWQHYAFSRSFF